MILNRNYSLFMCQDKDGKQNRERNFSFVLDNACDERTKPSVLHRIMGSFVTGLFQNLQKRTKFRFRSRVFAFVLVDEQAISR